MDVLEMGPTQKVVWDYLVSEKIGDELLFKGSNATSLRDIKGIHTGNTYTILARFERSGLLTREKLGHGKGILLKFTDPTKISEQKKSVNLKPKSKPKSSPVAKKQDKKIGDKTVTEVIESALAEIVYFEKEIVDRRVLIDTLKKYVGERV